MRLPPPASMRNPGKVATGAPGRGRISAFAPRRFGFLPAAGSAGPLPPGDAESGEPGMANFWLGDGDGFGVCAPADDAHARAAAELAATSQRRWSANIAVSRPRRRALRQILPLRQDRLAHREPELVLPFARHRREPVRAATELATDALHGGLSRGTRELVGLRRDDENA